MLVLWDNNKGYVENLCFKWNIPFSESALFSLEELKQNRSVAEQDTIIVLLETNLDGKKRTDFYGLQIVRYLRKETCFKGLIVVYSVYSEEEIREKIKGYEILFTSGIRMRLVTENGIDVSGIEEVVQSVPRLSDDVLEDIRYNVFDARGKMHELLHNLKNDLSDIKGKDTLAEFIQEADCVFDGYKELLKEEIEPSRFAEFDELYRSLIDDMHKDIAQNWEASLEPNAFAYGNSGNQVNKYANQLVELAPLSGDDEDQRKEDKINWEVLFFDDTAGIREKIRGFFGAKGIVCHLATTEQEVYSQLQEHHPNISLFISDIRLMKDHHWLDRQGYDVIEQVNNTSQYPLVYAVLTSKKGTIQKMVQKKRKYDILWFSKDDVINNAKSFNVFFDVVKTYAEENYNSNKVFQPKATNTRWNQPYPGHFAYPLKEYYKHHKVSYNEYIEAEAKINRSIRDYIDNNIDDQFTGLKKTLFPGNIDWTKKLLQKSITDTEVNHFRYINLLGRRLVLAMIFFDETLTPKDVILGLKTIPEDIAKGKLKDTKVKDRDKTYEKYIDGAKKQIINSHLALSTSFSEIRKQVVDFTQGNNFSPEILIEEYNFLKSEFIEEDMSNKDDLGEDAPRLDTFVGKTIELCRKKDIDPPNALKRVKYLLDASKVPKSLRWDALFSELEELDQANGGFLRSVKTHNVIRQMQNKEIIDLLRKYEWV